MSGARPDPDAARRAELAAFLKARRAALQPADVGLTALPGKRKTPGLRREEVAQISGVGLTWYTWLEQARPVTISEAVIDALAPALRLDQDAQGHLRYLAGFRADRPDQHRDEATPQYMQFLDTVMPAPACLLDPRFDLVAWNDAFASIWDPAGLPPDRCNIMWLVFADPSHRQVWVNWEERSRLLLAEFRAAAGRHAGDPRFAELIEVLSDASSEFCSRWSQHEVKQSIAGTLTIRLPSVGTIRFDVVDLRVSAADVFTFAVHMPARLSDQRKLRDVLSGPRNHGRHGEHRDPHATPALGSDDRRLPVSGTQTRTARSAP